MWLDPRGVLGPDLDLPPSALVPLTKFSSNEGLLDEVEVRCELQREHNDLDDASKSVIAKSVQHHVKTLIGVSTRVVVLGYEQIPRTQTGKARRVIDNRPRQV